MEKSVGSVELRGTHRDPDDVSVGDECDEAGGPDDGTRVCCGGVVGERWTESFCAAGAEDWELDEGPSGQVQEGKGTGCGPI